MLGKTSLKALIVATLKSSRILVGFGLSIRLTLAHTSRHSCWGGGRTGMTGSWSQSGSGPNRAGGRCRCHIEGTIDEPQGCPVQLNNEVRVAKDIDAHLILALESKKLWYSGGMSKFLLRGLGTAAKFFLSFWMVPMRNVFLGITASTSSGTSAMALLMTRRVATPEQCCQTFFKRWTPQASKITPKRTPKLVVYRV